MSTTDKIGVAGSLVLGGGLLGLFAGGGWLGLSIGIFAGVLVGIKAIGEMSNE